MSKHNYAPAPPVLLAESPAAAALPEAGDAAVRIPTQVAGNALEPVSEPGYRLTVEMSAIDQPQSHQVPDAAVGIGGIFNRFNVKRWARNATAVGCASAALGLSVSCDSAPNAQINGPQHVAENFLPNVPANLDCVANGANLKGPFHVRGSEILQANGKRAIFTGTTISGLGQNNYEDYERRVDTQIAATAKYWCGNMVRIQASQNLLVGYDGTSYSPEYMRAVEGAIRVAEYYGLAVVLNDDTEQAGFQVLPTEATKMFWKQVITALRNDPNINLKDVIYDDFNEPRQYGVSKTITWEDWLNGVTIDGVHYVGQQELVEYMRLLGAKNMIWVEGIKCANTLAGYGKHQIDDPLKLTVPTIHHVEGPHTPKNWRKEFGYLPMIGIPVVVSEFADYAQKASECWQGGAQPVLRFFKYIVDDGVSGETDWTLAPGKMIQGNDMDRPTQIKSNWACKDGLDQGAGAFEQRLNFLQIGENLPAYRHAPTAALAHN